MDVKPPTCLCSAAWTKVLTASSLCFSSTASVQSAIILSPCNAVHVNLQDDIGCCGNPLKLAAESMGWKSTQVLSINGNFECAALEMGVLTTPAR